MNKLITTYTGGMPFTLNDLTFVQKNLIDGIMNNVKTQNGLNADNIIVNGLEYNADTVKVSKGTFLYGDILYTLPDEVSVATSYPTGYEIYYIKSYDPDGNKVFFNGVTYDTYLLHNIGIATSADINAMSNVEWRVPLENTKVNGDVEWTDIELNDSYTYLTWQYLRIRKLNNSHVEIQGEAYMNRQNTSNPNLMLLGTLDKQYIPEKTINIAKGNENGSTATDGSVGSFLINNVGTVALRVNANIIFGHFYLNDVYPL